MPNKTFANYFNHLMNYQNQLLPDNKLSRDYMILYDYLMDLLEKDDVLGELLVRKKQRVSSINADILLDLTKLFNTRCYIYEPFLCLTLNGRHNERFTNILHPFCNKKLSIVPRKIIKSIWLAFHNGLLNSGSFVRGYQGDIYELTLSSNNQNESCICVNADSVDINLNIKFRILLNYTKQPNCEPALLKPYPENELNKEWLVLVPRNFNSNFEVSLPKLEHEIQHSSFTLVMILRLLRFLFEKHKHLCILNVGFLESIIYSEYMEKVRAEKIQIHSYEYIVKGVITRMYNVLKTKKCPYFWNERLNLIKSFDNKSLFLNAFHELHIFFSKFKDLENNKFSNFDDISGFFDFKMDPFCYEVDQFGIFKSY